MLRPTGKTVKAHLRRLWRDSERTHYTSAFSLINQMQTFNFDRGQQGFDKALLSWIIILDEISLWVTSISMALKGAMPSSQKRLLVSCYMLGGLASHLNAVRTLVIAGFDIPAKMLTRQIEEHTTLLMMIMDSEELCEEFHRCQEPEDSNKFWHRHISKGKLEKRVQQKIELDYPDISNALEELRQYFCQERIVLSAASHPSFLASAMAVGAGMSTGRGGSGMFGFSDAVSVRTLRVLFYYMFRFLILQKPSFEYLVGQIDKGAEDPFAEMARERKTYVYRLLLYVAQYRDELSLEGEFDQDLKKVTSNG